MTLYTLAAAGTLLAAALVFAVLKPAKKIDYSGQHVIVTGGSQGMGKAVAHAFVARGADVTILARTESTLKEAHAELEAARLPGKTQKIKYLSVDCTDPSAVRQAIQEAGTLDVLFCCAGSAHPGLFMDLSPSDLSTPMTGNYLSTLYCVHAALKSMLAAPRRSSSTARPGARKVVLTSSVAAFLNLPGYSSYTPTKVAIRALSDTLRLELKLYPALRDVSVHCVFPATIFTPGYEKEQAIKPDITKTLEGTEGQTAEEVARAVMQGLDRGEPLICTEIGGDLLRTLMKGPSPKNSVVDVFKSTLAGLVMPFVLFDFERKVKAHGRDV